MIGKTLAAAALAATAAAPAAAQSSFMADVIANTVANSMGRGPNAPDNACLAGESLPARRFERVRAGTAETMRTYLAGAGASASADASAAFTRDRNKREWLSGGTAGAAESVDDPLARALAAGTARLEQPGTVLAAGDGRSALAVWQVFAVADGARLGHYRVGFNRESGDFMIHRLELVEGPDEPAPVSPYCREPGDVERFAAWREGGKVGEFDAPPPAAGEAMADPPANPAPQ